MNFHPIVSLLFLFSVQSYHEGGPETMCLEYNNPNFSNALYCPYGMVITWIKQPPGKIIELDSFSADYILRVAPGIEGVCVHANLHACMTDIPTICYPTLQDQAGYITSSEAFVNVPLINGSCSFHSVTSLSSGSWTVIAHVRFSPQNGSTYDAAIGLKREVTPWVLPVAIVVPCVVAIIIALIIYYICKLKTKDYIDLPPSLAWFFNRQRVTKKYALKEKKHVSYYYKYVEEETKEYRFFLKLKETLDWGTFPTKSIIAVVCLPLAQTFSNYRIVLNNRSRDDPHNFFSEDWKVDDPLNQRAWTLEIFKKKIQQYDWNDNIKPTDTAILPVVHGTDKSIAKKIVANGFAALSGLDDGWYGKGIYFSTSVKYITPYFASKNKPAILICLLLPGNPYPVIEDHDSEKSLLGSHIKRGYQSNYVVTNKSGLPASEQDRLQNNLYDEIVIEQQPQVVPIFIVELEKEGLEALVIQFNRSIVELKLREKPYNIRTNESKAIEEVLEMPKLPVLH